MAETSKAGSKKITDVAKPGQSAPPANSKSVIVSNRPLLRDPMVVDETAAAADSKESSKSPVKPASEARPKPAVVVEPTAGDDKPANVAAAAAKEDGKPESAAEAADKPAEPESPAAPPDPDKAETEAEAPAAADTSAESEPAADKTAEPSKNEQRLEAAAAAETKRQAAIDKLVESKQYYLPINTIEKRRSRRFVALGIVLSLVLIVAWADIALDAGLIQINGVKPVTHFFSN